MMLPNTDNCRRATKLGPADVVCGRTALARSHGGNLRFRQLISKFGPTYQDAKSRKKKKQITMDIIKAIFDQGGNFLRATCDSPMSEDPDNLSLTVASEDFVYEKVSHALRSFRSSPRQRISQLSENSSQVCSLHSRGSSVDSSLGIGSLRCEEDEDELGTIENHRLYQPIPILTFGSPQSGTTTNTGDSESRLDSWGHDFEPLGLQCHVEVHIDPAELRVLFEP